MQSHSQSVLDLHCQITAALAVVEDVGTQTPAGELLRRSLCALVAEGVDVGFAL